MDAVPPRRDAPAHSSLASSEMQRVLDGQPEAVLSLHDRGASIQQWRHGPLHDRTQPMADHVFMTYLGAAKRIERRCEGKVERTMTRVGSVTLIPADSEARWDIEGPLQVIHLYLAKQRLHELADELGLPPSIGLVPRTASPDPLGSQLLQNMGNALGSRAAVDAMLVETATDMLCLHLLRSHSTTSPKRPEARPTGGLAPWQLKRVTEYLEEHFAEDISLATLSELTKLSTHHLCRAFRQSTGMPPHRWLCERRLEKARTLLIESDLPVADIAARVGFQHQSFFAASFRRSTGMTPTSFRRNRR